MLVSKFEEKKFELDEAAIHDAYQNGTPYVIETYVLPHELELGLDKVLTIFLDLAQKGQIKDYVVYCVQELAVNAKKANTKRVYFEEKNLNIEDPVAYKRGMETFKRDTLNNIDHYLELQLEKQLYIRIIFVLKDEKLKIVIRNNSVISKTELLRVHDKIVRSRQYKTMEDAFAKILDDSEGAGLGLVVLVLMLKKMNLTEDCFEISRTESETVTALTIPLVDTSLVGIDELTEHIISQITSLPRFPDNIAQVQRLAANPKCDMGDIAKVISTDVAMTADLIKLVNSAKYMMIRKIDSIFDAVKIVGVQGIKNLLYSYGTQKVLGDESVEKKALWQHSYNVAYYAYNLVKNFKKNQTILDDVYLDGILHDMGKIIFLKMDSDFAKSINEFCAAHGVSRVTFEAISEGINHAEIGARIAEKWNFPDNLAAGIRFHHNPKDAPSEYREEAEVVYFANFLDEYAHKRYSFADLDLEVAASFGIKQKQHVDLIVSKLAPGLGGK
jgi:HD-like signal output (HDOD) protein